MTDRILSQEEEREIEATHRHGYNMHTSNLSARCLCENYPPPPCVVPSLLASHRLLREERRYWQDVAGRQAERLIERDDTVRALRDALRGVSQMTTPAGLCWCCDIDDPDVSEDHFQVCIDARAALKASE